MDYQRDYRQSLLWYQMDTDWPTSNRSCFHSNQPDRVRRIPGGGGYGCEQGASVRAQANIREHGQEKRIGIRISDGFAALKQGEVDSAVIAGMGGPLMIRILKMVNLSSDH